ncbi:hypothetical protein RFN66_07655 [Bacillus paralicheniformis]|nr:hypothetical protein [Bacillus paralicheniformis]WMW49658.1 hypothetical protein RFN66_07655 [Bacillus paralicheniformis]
MKNANKIYAGQKIRVK